ncbi:hypothetical protein [Paraburkholderia haematera]|uniref:Lipoprotein n=1 Tax=Paraburkholderia haematera TaxID=2793077 RepID=A0ABM8S5Z5_9BURK|nr:hypothetical protein [Paraburkholderia haematera]CAE6790910.1 hypothetical protein R69888_04752 [Paraburkholderia haematera]
MNRLVFVAAAAYVGCVSPVFAQSNSTFPSSAIEPSTTTFPSASIAQNFQFINHPPPPAPASSVASTGSGRGHRHRQMSTDSDATGAASTQP